jgi:hypothetical protein
MCVFLAHFHWHLALTFIVGVISAEMAAGTMPVPAGGDGDPDSTGVGRPAPRIASFPQRRHRPTHDEGLAPIAWFDW